MPTRAHESRPGTLATWRRRRRPCTRHPPAREETVRRTKIESGTPPPLSKELCHIRMPMHTLRTDAQTLTLGPQNCPAHLAPHTFFGAREGVLETVAAVKTRRRHVSYPGTGPGGAGTGLEPSLGHDRSRIPAMASSQGGVRSSPIAYPAVRSLPL
eukprot:scaffold9919_cov60-Phaeocystis_antarctica.AAC.2